MVNVQFDFQDSNGNEIYSKVIISPAIAPIAYSSSIITSDSVTVIEKGQATTVSLVPNTYNVRLIGFNTTTEFLISVPSMAEGTTIRARDYLASVIPSANYNAVSSSYAQFALSASYAPAPVSCSYALSSSYAPAPATASYAISASYADIASSSFGVNGIPTSDVNVLSVIDGDGIGQSINIVAATGLTTKDGGNVNLTAGTGGQSSGASGNGGTVNIGAGYSKNNVAGSLFLKAGDTDAGTAGNVVLWGQTIIKNSEGGDNTLVGINTDYPQFALDVNGDASINTHFVVGAAGNNRALDATANDGEFLAGDVDNNTGTLRLQVNKDGNNMFSVGNNSNGDSNIYVDGSQNFVGIGTSTPATLLDVNGNAQFMSGNTSIGGDNVDGIGLVFWKNGNGLVGGLATENSGATLTLGVNESQLGTRNNLAPGLLFRLDTRTSGQFIVYGSPAGGSAFNNLLSIDCTSGDTLLVNNSGNVGIGNTPSHKLDVTGDINFTTNLLKNGSAYVPANATSASYALSSSYAVNASSATSASYVNAATVQTSQTLTMPYSASAHALTPTVATGSHYVQVGATNLLYVYNGTRWTSASLA